MTNTELTERKTLQQADWQVSKASRYNSGSETVAHSICKSLVGHYLKHELGYRVAFEVAGPTGEIDVLAWGKEDRISPLAVECETDPTVEIQTVKEGQYIEGQPIEEMHLLDVNLMPETIEDAYEWVCSQL